MVDAVIAAIDACAINDEPVLLANANSNEPCLVNYKKAMVIYDSDVKRGYVEACMIASQDLKPINDLLEIPIEVLDTYRKFFFDVENFDKLSLLEVVDKCKDPSERGTKTWALTQGLEFMAWRLGRPVNINPVEGLKELFTLCMYKSKEALFSGNASDSSKEATKWTKLSLDMARLLKMWVLDGDAARRDIELAIASIDPSFESFDSILAEAEKLDKEAKKRAEKDEGPTDNMETVEPEFGSLDDLLNEADNGNE